MLHRLVRQRLVRALAAGAALALLAAPALGADGPGLTGVVNVNTATLDELQLLPGIGESRAQASSAPVVGGLVMTCAGGLAYF